MNQKLTKHMSFECNCTFDGRKCNPNPKRNNDKSQCECKKYHICGKIISGILLHVVESCDGQIK